MANILPNTQPKKETDSYISRFFKEHKLGTLLNKANIRKEDGFSPLFFFSLFFPLFFMVRTFIELWSQAESRMLLKRTPSIVCSIILHTIGESFLLC